ncbi:DUF305 domain-containing protein [Catenuloplanes atrovinosus]|uniref:Uncharacterized protein (DUF305 family) n=1 Tax=Catenuloplanes atrovinosus TaxID=137266 RepID=A0AAE3YVY1_9ACTN|nr:DUF305 domain-containing protein [Catenuloplanes atrovinosus]MDR7280685.1 uncharacterized protein (DUF305 family) [Catenuloplanes atrovinosus]
MRLTDRRVLIGAGAIVVLAATATGIALTSKSDGEDPVAAPGTASAAPVPQRSAILPGRPGESARVVLPTPPSGGPGAPGASDPWNQADADFLRKMIPHHRQAVEISGLAATRAGNPRIVALADRIADTQTVEINAYRGWLTQRNLGEELPGHDHATMPGMQSPERIAELTAMSGDEFDRRFVEMMTDHHAGAIAMADEALRAGENPWVAQIATSVAHEQAVEIDRMSEIIVG